MECAAKHYLPSNGNCRCSSASMSFFSSAKLLLWLSFSVAVISANGHPTATTYCFKVERCYQCSATPISTPSYTHTCIHNFINISLQFFLGFYVSLLIDCGIVAPGTYWAVSASAEWMNLWVCLCVFACACIWGLVSVWEEILVKCLFSWHREHLPSALVRYKRRFS